MIARLDRLLEPLRRPRRDPAQPAALELVPAERARLAARDGRDRAGHLPRRRRVPAQRRAVAHRRRCSASRSRRSRRSATECRGELALREVGARGRGRRRRRRRRRPARGSAGHDGDVHGVLPLPGARSITCRRPWSSRRGGCARGGRAGRARRGAAARSRCRRPRRCARSRRRASARAGSSGPASAACCRSRAR